MNESRLLHIVQNPDAVDAQTALELQAMASDMPWFSTPRTLLARYYKSKNDYRETDSLHHAALRIQDRRWLYHFLHQGTELTLTHPQAPIAQATGSARSENTVADLEPIAQTTSTKANQASASETDADKSADTRNKTNQASASEADADKHASPSEAVGKPHFEPAGDPTEQHTETPNENQLSKELEAMVDAVDHKTFSFAPAEVESTAAPESPAEKYDVEDHFVSESPSPEPQDFFSWLNQAKNEELASDHRQTATEPEEQISNATSSAEPLDSATEESLPAIAEVPDYSLEHLNTAEEPQPEEPKFLDLAARQALIDKFIATNPSISRPKKEFYNPEVAMKRAEEFDASVCSETLAALFRKQQAWDKALACYGRLQLKFPEKSAYFAALITEVKNEKLNHES